MLTHIYEYEAHLQLCNEGEAHSHLCYEYEAHLQLCNEGEAHSHLHYEYLRYEYETHNYTVV